MIQFPQREDVRLRRAPLAEVICQVRFPPILRIASEQPVAFQERIRGQFPQLEVEQGMVVQMEPLGTAPPSAQPQPRIYRFKSPDRKTILDVTEDREEGLAMLEIAADMGDESAFVQAAGEIDWSQRPAADFVRAVYLALAAGAHLMARKLADQGHRLHPDHEELAKMARILAPPRVVRTGLPPVPSIRANRAWLEAHANEYRGQWVALRNGRLLAVGATAQDLKDQLESIEGVLLARAL